MGIYINRLVFPANLFERSDATPHHFARISFLGELSLIYFIKALPAQSQQYSFQSAKDKPVEFILDSKDGQIYKSTLKNLELLIAEDRELAEEFKNQTKDKDIKLYVFLRKYNARHPFEFRAK